MRNFAGVVVVVLVMLAAGCASGGPSGYKSPQQYTFQMVPLSPDDAKSTDKVDAKVRLEMTMALPKSAGKPKLYGAKSGGGGRTLIPAHYSNLLIPRSDYAIGRRGDDGRWYRIDRRSRNATPYDFDHLGFVSSGIDRHAPGRFVGYSADARGRNSVTLLDDHGQAVVTLDDLRPGKFGHIADTYASRSSNQPIDYLGDDAYLAHFEPENADPFSLVYNLEGDAISPPFPPAKSITAVHADPKSAGQLQRRKSLLPVDAPAAMPGDAALYWPLESDGSVQPKPDGLIGLEPLRWSMSPNKTFFAWKVWWMTNNGPAFALENQWDVDLPALLATRENAKYDEIEWDEIARWDGVKLTTLPRLVARLASPKSYKSFVAVDRTPHGFMEVYAGPMSKEGVKSINTGLRVGNQYAAYEAKKKAYDEYQAKLEAKRQAEAAAAAERRRKFDEMHALYLKRLNEGDVKGAESAAWSLGFSYVANVAKRYPDQASAGAMSVARSQADYMHERRQWDQRIRARQGTVARRYYGNSGGTSSGGNSYVAGNAAGEAAVRAAQARTAQRLADQAFQSRLNYINGKQSWYLD